MPTVTVNDNQKQYSIGSLTGTVVYATNGEAIGTVNVYDQKGRVVRSLRKGLGGYVEDVNTIYTFTGAVDNTTANVNVKYGQNFVATTNYTYKYGIKTKMKLSVAHGNSAMARETEYTYDAIGRLQGKNRQLYNSYNSTCSYTYDVHGWLTTINSGGFQEKLYYADTEDGIDGTKYYNGNISAYKWKNRDDNAFQGYIFKYDGNNRLREATYGWGNSLTSNKNYFSEYVDEYDRNGNILRLRRRGLTDSRHGGFGNVDDLYMTYSGNKLTSVRDNATHDAYNGATDFKPDSNDKTKSYPLTYNEAGSLVSDAGRKIAKIEYDNFNNPARIQFTNGNVTNYVYSVTGEKLRVIYQTSVYPENAEIVAIGKTKELTKEEEKCIETIDYLLGGALTLRNGVIDKYQFEEGYCQATPLYWEGKPFAETFTFCYYDQDHLGNVRQVTMDDGSKKGEVIQRMNYYPFGAEFCNNSTKSYVQNHKYNGKEFDNMHGLNTYDYGARQYNPVTGRWDRMDPLCEKYYPHSPFAYCGNNPVNLIDPNGKEWGIRKEGDQYVIYANVEFHNNANLSTEDVAKYQNAIKSSFAELISDATGGKFIGEINFDTPQKEDQLNLSLSIGNSGEFINAIGGAAVPTHMKNGNKLSTQDLAYSAIHELLHTLTLPDLVDKNSIAVSDTKLEYTGKKDTYNSAEGSAPNLRQNVMSNYRNVIDGGKIDVTQKQYITQGQFDYIYRNVKLQMRGKGKNCNDEYHNTYGAN